MKKVKKINKIPKYTEGTPAVDEQSWVQRNLGLKKGVAGAGQIAGAVGGSAQGIASALGIEQGKTGQIISGVGQMVSNFGPIGQIVGAGLQTIGAFTGGGGAVDENTGDITESSGLTRWLDWGRSDESLLRKSNRIKNSNLAREMSANLQAEWANNPNVEAQPAVLAKDGGVIIGDPSKGLTRVQVDSREVITDEYGNNAVRLPYAEGTDSIPALIQPKRRIFSDDNGFADIAEKIIKGTEEGSRLRQLETNNLTIIQEMTKIKKPTNSKILHASDGDIVPYSYDKNLSNFKYWDVKNNDYTKDYLDWVNTITDQDVKDIYSGKYGNMNTYLGKNKNYIPTVEEARKLMTDRKYGDWHKIAQIVYDKKNSGPEAPKKLSALDMMKFAATPGSLSADSARNLKITTPGMSLHKPKSKLNISSDLGAIADYTPLLAAYLNDPEFHVETPETWTPAFAPVAVSIEAQRRAIDDSMAMARYNQSNISPNTGAGMAYGLQAASNRAKQLADVYAYQTNAQNELIGRNVDRYNQWAPSMATARYQAIADTRANEAAADAQRDVRIKDAMSYLRDRQTLPFLKQYLSSGAYDKSIKKLS